MDFFTHYSKDSNLSERETRGREKKARAKTARLAASEAIRFEKYFICLMREKKKRYIVLFMNDLLQRLTELYNEYNR